MSEEIEKRRVELSDGGWLVFREAEVITTRQRRPFMRVMNRMQRGEDITKDIDYQLDWSLSIAFMVIDKWSREEELPKVFDDFALLFEDMPAMQSDTMTIAAIEYFNTQIQPPPEDGDDVVEPEPPPPTKRPSKRSATP